MQNGTPEPPPAELPAEVYGKPPGFLVQPCPIEVTIGVTQAAQSPDGKPYVVLRVETVVGSMQYVLTPDMAQQIADVLKSSSLQAASGLQAVPGLIIPG